MKLSETPAKAAKAAGLKSLAVVVEMTGGVSYQTLTNWHKNKPELFRIVIAGCKATIDGA
jgi:hypothetical protein